MNGNTDFLRQYDAAPEARKYPLVHEWLQNRPLEFFEELRRKRPIMETPVAVLIAKHADVLEALSHPTVFSVRLYKPKMGTFMLTEDETPSHDRDKAVMRAMLNRDDLPKVRELVGRLADEQLDRAGGEIELVEDFSRTVPVRLVGEYFGFPGPDIESMKRWSYANQLDAFHNHPFDLRTDSAEVHQAAQAALLEMKTYLEGLIRQRAGELKAGAKRDDVLSRMLLTKFPDSIGFTVERLLLNTGAS
jgi:cytochrome P450